MTSAGLSCDWPGFIQFKEIWLVDTEYTPRLGERIIPICLAALELRTGEIIQLWEDELGPEPPYPLTADSLFVAYNVVAEFSFHLALGWKLPSRVLDLYVEFRWLFNGIETITGRNSLISALIQFGLDSIGVEEKEEMHELAKRGGPWTEDERKTLQEYCLSDVTSLKRLLPVMVPRLDVDRSLYRGRFQCSIAQIEYEGTPIDTELLAKLNLNWKAIVTRMIAEIDKDFGVFDGTHFRQKRFQAWLEARSISWPLTNTGRLRLDNKKTFKSMARALPILMPLYQLRKTLSQMRLQRLEVGADGRNRCSLRPFVTITARNAPPSSKYIFGLSAWLRSLIRSPEGYALTYLDWHAQEYAIAAALSRDLCMMEDYHSGDPYLGVGKRLELIPKSATKATAGEMRDRLKICALAINYGMQERTLAGLLQISEEHALWVIGRHHEIYHRYWLWSNAIVRKARAQGWIFSLFGWRYKVTKKSSEFTLRNFPVQANGSECLHWASCLISEVGIKIVALVHDALMICSPLDRLEEELAQTEDLMRKATAIVLSGFEVRTEAKTILAGERFKDPRGAEMFERVIQALA